MGWRSGAFFSEMTNVKDFFYFFQILEIGTNKSRPKYLIFFRILLFSEFWKSVETYREKFLPLHQNFGTFEYKYISI
jgi:hypothetical protein